MDPRTERMLAERRAREAEEAALPRPERLRKAALKWLSGYGRLATGAVTIGLFAMLVGHYLFIRMPARERDRQLAAQRNSAQQQATQNLQSGVALDTCLSEAEATYAAGWDAECTSLRRAASCSLPSPQAQALDAGRRQAREACVKRHAGQ